jgi:hypothetical protein
MPTDTPTPATADRPDTLELAKELRDVWMNGEEKYFGSWEQTNARVHEDWLRLASHVQALHRPSPLDAGVVERLREDVVENDDLRGGHRIAGPDKAALLAHHDGAGEPAKAAKVECDCHIPELEGAGQHSPTCALFRARPEAAKPQTAEWATTPLEDLQSLRDSLDEVSRPAAAPSAPSPDAATVNLHDSPAADVWAKEWCRIAKELRGQGRELIDEGWMIGWFANAMCAATDHQSRKPCPDCGHKPGERGNSPLADPPGGAGETLTEPGDSPKDRDAQRYDNCREWWTILDRLAGCGAKIGLSYDRDYGIDKRRGWSVCINGVVQSQFADSPQEAVMQALVKSAAVLAR